MVSKISFSPVAAGLSLALSHTNDLDREHRADYSGTLGLRIN